MNRTQEKVQFAWMHLTMLCGTNRKVPVERRGKSIYIQDPLPGGTRYRISAEKFDAGQAQFRESWCIEPWSGFAETTTKAERNWQT